MKRAFLLLLICGCSRSEDTMKSTDKDALTRTLLDSRSLVFHQVMFAADGGSILFCFKTDQGTPVDLLALHQNKEMGGNPNYQEFRVRGSARGDFELLPYSALEAQFLRLAEKTSLAPAPEEMSDGSKPTQGRLDWLLARIKSRSLKWSRLP